MSAAASRSPSANAASASLARSAPSSSILPLVSRSRNAITCASVCAPMKPSAGWPLTKAMTAGIDWMPICPAMSGYLSMSIFASFTLPLAARTAFSRTGVSCLQGPHQVAQKSTSTGWCLESSMTSFMKDCVVTSLISPSMAAGAAISPPCSMLMCRPGSVHRLIGHRRAECKCRFRPNRPIRRKPARLAADGRSIPGIYRDRHG